MKFELRTFTITPKGVIRRSAALIAAAAAAAALTACKDAQPVETAPTSGETPVAVHTADESAEARAAALDMLKELSEAGKEEETLDYSDEAQIKAYAEKRGAICTRLTEVELGAEDAAAQDKLRRGAEKMRQYLEALPAYCLIRGDGTEEEEKMRVEITSVWASANGDLDEARDMLSAAEVVTEDVTEDVTEGVTEDITVTEGVTEGVTVTEGGTEGEVG
jgi:hypothetical protein